MNMNETIKEIIRKQIEASFIPACQSKTTDPEGLGVAVAHYFRWDGLAILETFSAALEDANYHTENETVAQWIEKLRAEN